MNHKVSQSSLTAGYAVQLEGNKLNLYVFLARSWILVKRDFLLNSSLRSYWFLSGGNIQIVYKN